MPSSSQERDTSVSRSEMQFSIELITEIMRHLDPVDIARMREACHQFYDAANTRLVWKTVMERVMEEHGIFPPTFPLDDMSIEQLEDAASGPHRFMENIEKNSGDRYRAYQDRTFTPLSTSNGMHTSEKITLVPGGRYLITEGDGDICLWDLGFSPKSPINPYPLCVLSGNFKLEDVSPSPSDKDELVLAVTSVDNNADILKIYALDPTNAEPEFEEKATFKFPSQDLTNVFFFAGPPGGDGRLKSAHLNQDFVFVYCHPFFVVWDWVKGAAARWDLDDSLQEIFVCDKAIITCDTRGAFGIFDSPWWLRRVPGSDCSQMRSVRLNPRCPFGQQSQAPVSRSFAGTPTWQQQTSASPHLCLLTDGEPWDREPVLYLYSIRRLGKPLGDHFLPSCLPAGAGVNWTTYGLGHSTRYKGAASSLFKCASRLVLCTWSSDSTFIATTFSLPTESSRNELSPSSAILTTPVKLPEGPYTGKQFGFCPMSGRLVYAVVRDDAFDEPETEIHVCDYLLPLEFQGQAETVY